MLVLVFSTTPANIMENSEHNKKSLRKQMEELATARGLKTELVFVKPPGYEYNIG